MKEEQIDEQFEKFCKKNNWNSLILGVDYDYYKKFLKSEINTAFLAGQEMEREKIAEKLYALLPTGEVDAFSLIKEIKTLYESLSQPTQ